MQLGGFSFRSLVILLAALMGFASEARAQRSLGMDVSAWQGNISQAQWNAFKSTHSRDFVFIRSSRGGTTGFYNQSDADNSNGLNTLSQRYDDPYFVQNITRATNAGMFAGSYHFSRPDIIETTFNDNGIANTGTDEADHFIQMAGPWMRPGYLVPVFDLEAGSPERTANELAQFSIDFSNRIFAVTGVRPAMYINGNYSQILQGASPTLRTELVAAYPTLWTARYVTGTSTIQTGHPKDTFAGFYGPWDDAPNPTHPWDFWQHTSSGSLAPTFSGNLDLNVAQGGIEFVKDFLVPALWVPSTSGDWSTLANWNSGQSSTAPVQGPGQVARVGTMVLPTQRLPSTNDTVILDKGATDVTVTLSTGAHSIRKLTVRESLNISGGSLTVGYTPVADSTPLSAQFSAPVTLSGTGAFSAHTLQVDATRTFAANGGTLSVNTLNLMPHTTTPAKLQVGGDITLAPLAGATATIRNGTGTGTTGSIDLAGAERQFTVTDGAAAIDASLETPIANGALWKKGPGTLRLTSANTYAAGTTVSEGVLLVNNTSGSGTGTGPILVNANGVLGGAGTLSGLLTVEGAVAPGTNGIGQLGGSSASFSANSELRLEINGAASFDRLNLAGALTIDPAATIKVQVGGGYTPAFGTQFTVISGAASLSGVFGAVTTTGGGSFGAKYVGNNVVLEALSGLGGDFNNDRRVDTADYTVWREKIGDPVGTLFNGGGSGVVGEAQFGLWVTNFGMQLPSAASAVPEPTSMLILLAACGLLFRSRR